MSKHCLLFSTFLISLCVMTCGKKPTKKVTKKNTSAGSCVETVVAFIKCDNYTAVTEAELKAAESGCLASSVSSKWYTEVCNPEGAMGVCSTNFPGGSAYTVYYFGDFTAKSATAVCSAEYTGSFLEL